MHSVPVRPPGGWKLTLLPARPFPCPTPFSLPPNHLVSAGRTLSWNNPELIFAYPTGRPLGHIWSGFGPERFRSAAAVPTEAIRDLIRG